MTLTRYISLFVLLLLSCARREPEYLMRELTPEGNPTNVVYSIVRGREDFDTLNSRGKKVTQLSGYFKITAGRKSRWQKPYDLGNLLNGKKTGTWKRYPGAPYPDCLEEVITYDSIGRLQGDNIYYNCQTGKIVTHNHYKNDELQGEQKEYYANGNIFRKYYYGAKGYLYEHITLTPTGDTLYYENFGVEGTGYLKKYELDGILSLYGNLVSEGKYTLEKPDGVHKHYERQYLDYEKDTSMTVVAVVYDVYQNGVITAYKCINYYPEQTGDYIDSIIGPYKGGNPKGEWKYYYKGKIVKIITY